LHHIFLYSYYTMILNTCQAFYLSFNALSLSNKTNNCTETTIIKGINTASQLISITPFNFNVMIINCIIIIGRYFFILFPPFLTVQS